MTGRAELDKGLFMTARSSESSYNKTSLERLLLIIDNISLLLRNTSLHSKAPGISLVGW